MVKVSHINLEKDGLGKFFSPFESKILMTLWNEGSLTSAEIQRNLEERNLSMHLSTVSALLSRLMEKGFVSREESGSKQRFVYSAMQEEKELAEQISHTILENLNDAFGSDFYGFMRSYMEQKSRLVQVKPSR